MPVETIFASDSVRNVVFRFLDVSDFPCNQIVSATGTFLYVIAKYPHVQRKAQEEIDRVVSKNCIPELNDRPNLPYIKAMYREVLRFEPPASIVPHSLVEDDDEVDGYFIPKGLSDCGL
jgi:cytochrome P450